MEIIVRKLGNTEKGYCAYHKGLSGRATYMLYFNDDIYGAISLNHFMEMLKDHFTGEKASLCIKDTPINITNEMILGIISNKEGDRDPGRE